MQCQYGKNRTQALINWYKNSNEHKGGKYRTARKELSQKHSSNNKHSGYQGNGQDDQGRIFQLTTKSNQANNDLITKPESQCQAVAICDVQWWKREKVANSSSWCS